MSQTVEFIATDWGVAIAALARAASFAALAPTVGLATEGIRHRIVLAILLTLVLLLVPADVENPSSADCVALILQGLAVGSSLGFALRALLASVVIAAQLVEHQLGFPLVAEGEDDASAAAISRTYQILAITLFFAFGGHRLVLTGLIDADSTAAWVTSGGTGLVGIVLGLVTRACWFAVQIAVPLVLTLLTTSLTVGMISRMLPQSSVPTSVMPAQVAGALVLIFLSLAALVPAMRGELAGTLDWLSASH